MGRLAILLVLVSACVQNDGPEPTQCSTGEGPGNTPLSYYVFAAKDLTCTRHDEVWGCTGECCHAHVISTVVTPAACMDPCLALDETTCASNAHCYVARDSTTFYGGATDSFLGCYPTTFAVSSAACAKRQADDCASGGTCAGLYDASHTFLECVDESLVAGSCTEVATCTTPAPACAADRSPGVANGCYTGACIPNTLCQ